jgi:hypothetical protein
MRLQIFFKKVEANSRNLVLFVDTEDGNTETENLTNTFILRL